MTIRTSIATLVTDKIVNADVKAFAANKDFLNAFIVALASKWSVDEPIVISMGWAVRPLKWHASWVQNVVRQFGLYLSWAWEF